VKEKRKPVVVSMGDYAASGGYYISAGADRIVAEPTTITGSIGIYGGKFVVKGFYDWIGVTSDFLPKGRNAGFFRESETWTDSQSAEFQQLLERSYMSFIQKVATGRKRDVEYINSIGQGRAWTGAQAKERGLVDELGGMERAIEIAKELARIPADKGVRRVVFPAQRTLIEQLLGDDDHSGYAAAKARAEQQAIFKSLPLEMQRTLRFAARLQRAQEGGTLLMMPYELQIK
jgi:protease-4